MNIFNYLFNINIFTDTFHILYLFMRTRFAPSPTGQLHVGNMRTALFTYLWAQKENGEFILRIDDTDKARSFKKYETNILKTLKWQKLHWSSIVRQSQSTNIYQSIFDKAKKANLIYPAYETKQELDHLLSNLRKQNKPSAYKRGMNCASTKLNPYWRFALPNKEITWYDQIQGKMKIHLRNFSDPIIFVNENFTYLFCSVVDDLHLNISHIIRASDHLTNTAQQIAMFEAFKSFFDNKSEILWSHISLVHMNNAKISKRNQSDFNIHDYIENGLHADVLNNILVNLGRSKQVYDQSMQQLIENFNIANYSSSAVTFDVQQMNISQLAYNSTMSINDAAQHFENEEFIHKFWHLLRENLYYKSDIAHWKIVFTQKQCFSIENNIELSLFKKISKIALQHTNDSWHELIINLTKQLQISKKQIISIIRKILTGKSQGPKMNDLYEHISEEVRTFRFKNQ